MEDDSDDSETQPLFPKSARQSCFACKRSLEDKPYTTMFLKLFLGLLLLSHIWVFLVILYLKIEHSKGSFSTSLLPMISLATELLLTCTVVLVVIFNDLFYRRIRGITLWQRQAIGRLIRNIIILTLIGITLVLLYFNSDQSPINLWKNCWTLLILSIIVFLRFLLIASDYSLFWLLTSGLVLLQEILIILKQDFSISIDWVFALLPTLIFWCVMTIMLAYLIWKNKQDLNDLLLSFINFLGSILCLSGVSFGIFKEINESFYFLTIVGLFLLTIGFLHTSGSFIIDITIGHIDIEVLDLKHPIQTLSNAPHSV